jgi:hypothetical protein
VEIGRSGWSNLEGKRQRARSIEAAGTGANRVSVAEQKGRTGRGTDRIGCEAVGQEFRPWNGTPETEIRCRRVKGRCERPAPVGRGLAARFQALILRLVKTASEEPGSDASNTSGCSKPSETLRTWNDDPQLTSSNRKRLRGARGDRADSEGGPAGSEPG